MDEGVEGVEEGVAKVVEGEENAVTGMIVVVEDEDEGIVVGTAVGMVQPRRRAMSRRVCVPS